jgi:hypothetical protein
VAGRLARAQGRVVKTAAGCRSGGRKAGCSPALEPADDRAAAGVAEITQRVTPTLGAIIWPCIIVVTETVKSSAAPPGDVSGPCLATASSLACSQPIARSDVMDRPALTLFLADRERHPLAAR